jgi:glycosyltransferase involved in cell wall biosynthesis
MWLIGELKVDLKVCVLPYRRSASGIAAYTLEVAKALSSQNVKVSLITFGLTKNQRINLEEIGINVIEASSKDPVKNDLLGPLPAYILLSKRLLKVLFQENLLKHIDILHFTLPPATLSFKHYDTIVATAWVPLDFKEDMEKNFRSFKFPWNFLSSLATIEGRIIDDVAFRKASKIICPTKSIFQRLNDKYPAKVAYIRPPIKMPTVLPITKKDEDTISVLCVSRNLEMPRKNIVTFLRSLLVLNELGITNFRVVLVGKCSKSMNVLINSISKKAKISIKLIQFLPREKLFNIYSASDIFVCPSFYEEVGYTLLEAMASGLPVVASDIPTFREITEGGRNALLVPVNNYKAMALSLKVLIEDDKLRKRLGKESLRIIKQNYCWEVISRDLVSLYQSVLKDKPQ